MDPLLYKFMREPSCRDFAQQLLMTLSGRRTITVQEIRAPRIFYVVSIMRLYSLILISIQSFYSTGIVAVHVPYNILTTIPPDQSQPTIRDQ